MTLNQLRYFCTASRCHSITKAAEELYVTQPTVSVAIRDLEIEFGISLFYRKGNQLNSDPGRRGTLRKSNLHSSILQRTSGRLFQHGKSKTTSPYWNPAYA